MFCSNYLHIALYLIYCSNHYHSYHDQLKVGNHSNLLQIQSPVFQPGGTLPYAAPPVPIKLGVWHL